LLFIVFYFEIDRWNFKFAVISKGCLLRQAEIIPKEPGRVMPPRDAKIAIWNFQRFIFDVILRRKKTKINF